MALLKTRYLSKGEHTNLNKLAETQPEDFFFDGSGFNFPIERFADVHAANPRLRRPWLYDLSDDVVAANMSYNTQNDTTTLNFEMNDFDLEEISFTLSDDKMKELIHEAGHCDLSRNRLQQEVEVGRDRDGAPIIEMRTVSVFDWVDVYANDYKVLLSLLTAYLFDNAAEVFATPDTDKDDQPDETPDSTTDRAMRFAWEILPTKSEPVTA